MGWTSKLGATKSGMIGQASGEDRGAAAFVGQAEETAAAPMLAAPNGTVILVIPPEPTGQRISRDMAGGLGLSSRARSLPEPVLDVLYAAAVAERSGWRTAIVDAAARRWAAAAAVRAVEAAADGGGWGGRERTLVGLRLSLPTLQEDLALANRLKEAMPSARVFVFGSAIQYTCEEWIENARVDFVVYGEVEAVLPDLLVAEAGMGGVGGAHHRPGTRAALIGDQGDEAVARWKRVRDLDALPFPAWHLLDLAAYSADGRPGGVRFYVQTSRGCPLGCGMCPYVLHQGRRWRTRSVASVLDELTRLTRQFGARTVLVRDPNPSVDVGRLGELCEGIIARGLALELEIEPALERLDRATLDLLRRAGVFRMRTGVESVDAHCLSDIGQEASIPQELVDKIAYCRSIGIDVYAMFIVGLPHESWSSVLRTVAYAKRLGAEHQVGPIIPYPGTPIAQQLRAAGFVEAGVVRGGYRRLDGRSVMTRTLYLSRWELKLAWLMMRADLRAARLTRRSESGRSRRGLASLLRAGILLLGATPIRVYGMLRARQETSPVRRLAGTATRPGARRP